MIYHSLSFLWGTNTRYNIHKINQSPRRRVWVHTLAFVHRGQEEREERDKSLQIEIQGLSDARWVGLSNCPPVILKVYVEASTILNHLNNPDGLSNIMHSQGCVLKNGSHCGNNGQNSRQDKELQPMVQQSGI